MLTRIGCRQLTLNTAAVCALATCGCASSIVSPERLREGESIKAKSGPVQLGGHRFGIQDAPECDSCEHRQRLQDYAHRATPYVAGPFGHDQSQTDFTVQQRTIHPPRSKFHPVPTAPVFEPRAFYQPSQPIGVHLVPIPDRTIQPTMREPRGPLRIDSRSVPPTEYSELTGPSELGAPDTSTLSPPGN